jgi:hypothetical protein
MPCYHPIDAWYSKEVNPSGKRSLVFDRNKAKHIGAQVRIPCGQCIGCRLERSRQWAMRCVHESELYSDNCFITLTYDDDHLPDDQSLHFVDFQKFMKRLRKHYSSQKIRFFHCGEYGELCSNCGKPSPYLKIQDKCKCGNWEPTFGRPHYHACLFGFDFDDKVLWSTRNGNRLYTSDTLNKVWGKGYCVVGDVTFESAAYVARYIMKKITGTKKEEHYVGLSEEYTTMSRRPGIGAGWYEEFKADVFPSDFLIVKGVKVKPPKFYGTMLEREDVVAFERVKDVRQGNIDYVYNALGRLAGNPLTTRDNDWRRLAVKEGVKKEKIKALSRSIEY